VLLYLLIPALLLCAASCMHIAMLANHSLCYHGNLFCSSGTQCSPSLSYPIHRLPIAILNLAVGDTRCCCRLLRTWLPLSGVTLLDL
jgi:hypothetical protein